MINKYAEIQDRIILYNACKGILRVKQAALYKLAEDVVDPAAAQPQQPQQPQQQQAPTDPNAQQQGTSLTSYVPGAVGAVGGAIGGGYLGNKATGWLNKKLGLTKDRGGWRKWLGRGIQTVGTAGTAVAGALLGNTVANGLSGGWSNSSLENAKQRAARKAQRQAEIEQAAQQAVEPQA